MAAPSSSYCRSNAHDSTKERITASWAPLPNPVSVSTCSSAASPALRGQAERCPPSPAPHPGRTSLFCKCWSKECGNKMTSRLWERRASHLDTILKDSLEEKCVYCLAQSKWRRHTGHATVKGGCVQRELECQHSLHPSSSVSSCRLNTVIETGCRRFVSL